MSTENAIFLDWVRLTCPGTVPGHYYHVEQHLKDFWELGDERRLLGFDGQTFMALGFFGSRLSALGSYINDMEDVEWYFDAMLEVPGELCALLGKDELLKLCREMNEHGFDATRLDIAFDLRDPTVNVKLIEQMFKRDQVETRSEKRNAISGTANMGESCTLDAGGTLRIGNRQSEFYMKVYDKRTQHLKKTGIDIGHCTRFELEIKADKAKLAFRSICTGKVDYSTGEIVGPFDLAAFLKDHICFYKTPRKKEVCDWWKEIDQAPILVWPPYEHRATLDSTLHWLRTQVMPSIKALEEFGYGQMLRSEIQRARPSRDLSKYLKKLKESAANESYKNVPF